MPIQTPIQTDTRPLAFVTTAALTAYHVVSVVMLAFLFYLAARRSRGRLGLDLFGVVLAVAAAATS